MANDTKETKFQFIAPVQSMPSVRRYKSGLYDSILKEFSESNLKYAEIKEMGGRKPITIYLMLKKKIGRDKMQNINVLMRKGKLYLMKEE